jgi:hypothetical protein
VGRQESRAGSDLLAVRVERGRVFLL